DIFLVTEALGILVEVKTLDGTEDDERRQVRLALAQLLYYEAFVTEPVAGEASVRKIACFERPISDAHRAWLNRSGIGVIWCENDRLRGDRLAVEILGAYLKKLQ